MQLKVVFIRIDFCTPTFYVFRFASFNIIINEIEFQFKF